MIAIPLSFSYLHQSIECATFSPEPRTKTNYITTCVESNLLESLHVLLLLGAHFAIHEEHVLLVLFRSCNSQSLSTIRYLKYIPQQRCLIVDPSPPESLSHTAHQQSIIPNKYKTRPSPATSTMSRSGQSIRSTSSSSSGKIPLSCQSGMYLLLYATAISLIKFRRLKKTRHL